MQDKIFDLLLEQDDITWKTLLYDLVKSEEMDPWHIDISLLSQRFIDVIKEMQEHDLKISGKMLLAAAILLKLKSSHLIDHDIAQLDELISSTEEEISEETEDYEEDELLARKKAEAEQYSLIPRNPQPRSRKVSIHDLVDALQRAMETKKKVLQKYKPVKFAMPERKMDIMEVIRELYNKITYYSKKEKQKELTFTKLLPPRAGKMEKVFTFVPMLHLENQKKINTRQEKQFGEIYVKLFSEKTLKKWNSKREEMGKEIKEKKAKAGKTKGKVKAKVTKRSVKVNSGKKKKVVKKIVSSKGKNKISKIKRKVKKK